VIVGRSEEASQLPQEVTRNADLLWWVEDQAHDGRVRRVATLPAFAPVVAADAQVATDAPEKSGRMTLWASMSGRWTQVCIEEPRRG
jgi:hypothetical protein